MIVLIPLFLLAAFFLLRANPQRRRVQAQKALIDGLQPGAKVVTVSGIIGTLMGIEGDRAAIEVAPGVVVEFLVAAIARIVEDAPVDVTGDHEADGTVDGTAGGEDGAREPRHEET
jgi:preprotein translocase subunit YajC